MNNPKILLVEDDPNLGLVLEDYLKAKGYAVLLCRDGQEGWNTFRDQEFDMCVLDVMMPKIDGFSLAEKIRREDTETPIIFLTAKSLKEDTLTGLKIGADDYITKPFSVEELLLRIKAILKRTARHDEERGQTRFELGIFTFDFDAQTLTYGENVQRLTSKEAALLRMLCVNKNQVLNRSLALKKIWLDDSYFNSRSMDVYITKLRKFLKQDESLQIINVHGQGFKLVELKP